MKREISFTLQFKVLLKMTKLFTRTLFVAMALFYFTGCKYLNPSVMLKTKKNYPYAAGNDTVQSRYIMQKGDIITFRLYSNQGFKIVDLTTTDDVSRNTIGSSTQNVFTYIIEPDSMVNLPIIGRVQIGGLDLKQCELMLEDKYSNYYNDPFVMVQLRNRRMTVFPGTGGTAKVIALENEHTSVIEALALSGGITGGGKAWKVKLMRGSFSNPQVYKIDLSTPEGMAEAKMFYVRANDILYVQPSYFAGRQILSTTAQVLSLVTSSIGTTLLVLSLTN